MKSSAAITPANTWPYALLALAAVFAYINIFPNTFLFDDEFLLVKNTYIRSWSHLSEIFTSSTTAGFGGTDSFYRPLQIFFYLITAQIFGLSHHGFHALNVLLHAINACLVFALARRLGFQRMASLLAALLWTVHPIHTEAVTYMSATADTLSTLFVLATLLLWKEGDLRRQLLASGSFALALLSKETAIITPALLLIVLAMQPGFAWRKLRDTWPLWVLMLAYVLARATILNFNQDFDFYKAQNIYTENLDVRIYSFLGTLPGYFQLFFGPFGLHMERASKVYTSPFFLEPLLGAGILIASLGVIAAAVKWKENRVLRPLAFGGAWFFVAYAPCSGIVIPVNAIFLEHWMYLPSIGLFLGAGQALAVFLKGETSKGAAMIVAGIALFCLFMLTLQQNAVWRDPITFYTHILNYEEGSGRLHNNLAMAYDDIGRDDLALEHYQKAIELEDHYAQTHYNLGRLYLKAGNRQAAREEMQKALAIDPHFIRAGDMLNKMKANGP